MLSYTNFLFLWTDVQDEETKASRLPMSVCLRRRLTSGPKTEMPFRSLSMIEHLRDLRPGKTAEKESRFFLDVRKNKRKWRVHLLIRGGATFFVSLNVALETSGAGACRAFPFPTRLALPLPPLSSVPLPPARSHSLTPPSRTTAANLKESSFLQLARADLVAFPSPDWHRKQHCRRPPFSSFHI